MAVNIKTVSKIAKLAQLSIAADEQVELAQNMSNILELVEQMNQIDTDDVTPLAHPLDIKQRLRHDKITEDDQHQKFQEIAPAVSHHLYLVPKVITKAPKEV